MSGQHAPGLDFRVGDEWAFLTNNGRLIRKVAAIEDGTVYYRGFGDRAGHECSVKTFQRWLRGAELEFATDWSGRELSGRAAIAKSQPSPKEPT
jgi:hypothetical protein